MNNNKRVEIKRFDPEFEPTFWRVMQGDCNISDFPTFRRAWNCAKLCNVDSGEKIILDPLDK